MSNEVKTRRPRGTGALGDIATTKEAVIDIQRLQEEERRRKTERLRAQRLSLSTGSDENFSGGSVQ